MEINYSEYVGLFKALSDCNRLMIVDMLSCGERCACKLLEKFDITQPTLSHHMKTLTDCGLVVGRKEGKWTYYALVPERIAAFQSFLTLITSDKEECICKSPAIAQKEAKAMVCGECGLLDETTNICYRSKTEKTADSVADACPFYYPIAYEDGEKLTPLQHHLLTEQQVGNRKLKGPLGM